jgi:hypothetical protein
MNKMVVRLSNVGQNYLDNDTELARKLQREEQDKVNF